MDKKICFETQDLKLLKNLSEENLYRLNIYLYDVVTAAKRNIINVMLAKKELCELVNLAETACKEVAQRNGYAPEKSTGKYSTSGITYDTDKYRDWLVSCRRMYDEKNSPCNFLKEFSFYNELEKLH